MPDTDPDELENALENEPFHDPEIGEAPAQEFVIPEALEEGATLYQRQGPLNLQPNTAVTLIGCGGVGVWVALSLALAGVQYIDLYDGDTLSIHNLNRYPLPQGFIGESKSLALAQWLSLLRPDGEFVARGEFNPLHHAGQVKEWVVCATDSLKSRQMSYQAAQGAGSYYLEVGADGEGWSLSPNPPEFSTELEDQAGYQVTPVHVGPCMMAGAAAAYYILHGRVPIDSHIGKWDGQRVTLSSMPEEDYPTVECGMCAYRLARDGQFITMIKHVREAHQVNGLPMGLIEARALVQGWWDEAQPEVVEPEVVEVAAQLAEIAAIPDGVEREGDNE